MTEQQTELRLSEVTKRLSFGPSTADKAYVLSQTTYGEIYAMAAHIRRDLGTGSYNNNQRICLATDNKAVVAAAILSALAGGPQLIFPYAFTTQVLTDLGRISEYTCAIIWDEQTLPEGITGFAPRSDQRTWPTSVLSTPDPDSQWIHLFTGGSTGTPQIWPKTVRNLLAETIRIVESYGLTEVDRLVSTVSPLHIYGLLYFVLASLVAEAAVTPNTPLFPAEIEDEIYRYDAGVLISVPAHYRALRSHQGKGFSLKIAFSSAGVLATEDAEAFSLKTGVGIIEVYGSTETGGAASRVRYKGEEDFTPFDPVDLKIEEDNLLVRSAYLSPGLPLDKEGYYQIGDRAAFTTGNRFELLGRSDSVVKIGGKRVDLEGVRQVLKRHAGVTDAWVTTLPVGRARENQIVAVVEGSVTPDDLTPLFSDALEPYARPRRIRIVDKIPITAAGKYDRKTITELFSNNILGI
jgi:acyl-coenzyme A synthetase/AMP-(fatty) acid ligase